MAENGLFPPDRVGGVIYMKGTETRCIGGEEGYSIKVYKVPSGWWKYRFRGRVTAEASKFKERQEALLEGLRAAWLLLPEGDPLRLKTRLIFEEESLLNLFDNE